MKRILVTGAGGFIGTHLVRSLREQGHFVRGVDLKLPSWSTTQADEFWLLDLREHTNARTAVTGIDQVYALAADMGGMGHISNPALQAPIMYNNTMINFNTLESARRMGVSRYLFVSSVCVYPMYKLDQEQIPPLRESDVYPAQPQGSYGWEKLQAEHLCRYYHQSYGIETRIARLQNTYGSLSAWCGGREKAPAALCRKIVEAKLAGTHQVEIWGDGKATRSFMYVDDCVRGLQALMESTAHEPVTLGPDRVITIDQLVDIIAQIAGIEIEKVHVEGPQGVRGRNFDHNRAKTLLDWQPDVSLEQGLKVTYDWVEQQVMEVNSA